MGKKVKNAPIADDNDCLTDSNALVIERQSKKKPKNYVKKAPVQAKLSKRKRKKLELVISRREKKANRASVLSKLDDLPQVEIQNLDSVISLGQRTHGKKRKAKESEPTNAQDSDIEISDAELSEQEEVAASVDIPMSEKWDDLNKEIERLEATENEIEESNKVVHNQDEDEPLPFPTGEDTITGLRRVNVDRTDEVVASRNNLPITSEEHTVLEAVATNTVCIICGATGSGKTTQVPQFLYEAGYCSNGLIGVTEPRRVAAISMSHRVAKELNLSNSIVSYKIRYESNCTKDTKIKFMTDGVLLREVQDDFLLEKYSVLILDEAHERSEFTDILIGLLSRIAPLRKKRNLKPLKIVIMSATLRVEDFTKNKLLFKSPPPVVNIEARQFPVTAHFQKRTPAENEYLKEAYKRVCKLHRILPGGGILVFVTGKNEIALLTKWLEATFPRRVKEEKDESREEKIANVSDDKKTLNESKSGDESLKAKKKKKKSAKRLKLSNFSEEAERKESEKRDEEHENREVGSAEVPNDQLAYKDINQAKADEQCPLYVLPLHSFLPTEEQKLVFEPPPEGSRLCVVSTNVAETSLTIPNVKYVVDTGKEKKKVYDTRTGVSAFVVDWISKASADQRAGRAGRTGPGHCYRLFSSAVFTEFASFSQPEILSRPIDDLVLLLKSLGLTKVANFPFPNAPSRHAIVGAELHLNHLGALNKSKTKKGELSYAINDLGRTMTNFGISPRFAKMLALSNQHVTSKNSSSKNMLPYVVALVSAFTVREMFVNPSNLGNQKEVAEKLDGASRKARNRLIRETMKKWQGSPNMRGLGDIIVLLNAIIEFEKVCGSPMWCRKHGLRLKAMLEIRSLRAQLTDNVNEFLPQDSKLSLQMKLDELTSKEEADTLRQIVLSGLGDKIARRVVSDEHDSKEHKLKQLLGAKKGKNDEDGVKEKVGKNAYQAVNLEGFVYIHPHSVLAMELPEYIAFQEIHETSKMYAKDCIAIEDTWLPYLFPSMINLSEPLEHPKPFYDTDTDTIKCEMTCTYANNAWPIRAQIYNHPINLKYYKLFAECLLNGEVFSFFDEYKSKLESSPKVLIKSWGHMQPKVDAFVNALVNKQSCSKARLKEVWEVDSNFLLKEFLQWLPVDCTFSVQAKWPPNY